MAFLLYLKKINKIIVLINIFFLNNPVFEVYLLEYCPKRLIFHLIDKEDYLRILSDKF